MKTLSVQKLKPISYSSITDELKSIFFDILFRPLVKIIKEKVTLPLAFHNAASDVLRDALRAGTLAYSEGVFSGRFSAVISKELRRLGATFDKRAGIYIMEPSLVPAWISAEAGNAKVSAREAHAELKKRLDEIQKNLESDVTKSNVNPSTAFTGIEKGFKTAAQALSVPTTISADARARLEAAYNENMKLWIKKFSEEMIGELRGVVTENAEQGYRFDRLISALENRYHVTTSKAEFLARQETALFMSKYRKERFMEAGVRKYEWSAAMDERTRDDHKKLNGKIFFYSSPPITDSSTGRHNNPGEDYNCRCVDIPIIEEAA